MRILRRQQWLVIPAILLFYFLALDSLVGDSPTMDEQNHIARGLAYLRTGDPRLSVEHPPLVNSLSALPLLTMPEIRLPTGDASWERQPEDVFWYLFAEKLLWQLNRQLDIQQILFLARLPVVYLTIALALVGWHFAREMWGRPAAVFVFLLLLFDPNILAHGRYVTTDLGGTLTIFLATYLLWRMWQRDEWNWRRWFWAALGIGLAFSSKLSSLIFALIWPVMALLPLYPPPRTRSWSAAGRRLAQLALAGLTAMFLVWVVFLFEWGNFLFLDERLTMLNRFQGPMPTFWSGIERILLLSGGGRPSYLLGEFSNSGFLLYFPVAFLAKTPLLTLILFFAAALLLLTLKQTRRRALFLLLPLLLYFAASMVSALNLGYRHLLPILPLIAMLIGGLAAPPVRSWIGVLIARITGSKRDLSVIPLHALLVLVLSLVVIDVAIHPHYLSYFNLAAGGPANGQRILLDSNIDWGQDLLRLQTWMAQEEIEQIKLGWFGTADPDYYGLSYEALPGFPRQPFFGQWTSPPFDPQAPEPGLYAISASSLGELPLAAKNVYPWFRNREPDARIGYSILIFEVP